MSYYLTADEADLDPRWMVLAEGNTTRAVMLFAFWHRVHAASARHAHDGYVTHHEALTACMGKAKLLELLLTPVLGRPPLIHRKGDTCAVKNCIDVSPPWIDGFDYRVCGYSKRNPTRAETDRHKAQTADSRNKPLRDATYLRDGGCCRYCRSGPLPRKGMGNAIDRRKILQFDHIDPDRSAGTDGANYATTCARCNETKTGRTPAEADMPLLPEPTDAERAVWLASDLQLFDRPESGTDNRRDNRQDNPPDKQHDKQPSDVAPLVPDSPPEPVSAGDVCPQPGTQPTTTSAETAPEGSGSGRVGQPTVAREPRTSPYGTGGQIVRDAEYPDIYHRRPRLPATAEPPQPGGDP